MRVEEMSREDLLAIVRQLPSTRDGVPIVPGMTLYYRHLSNGRVCEVVVGMDLGCRWTNHYAGSRGDDCGSVGYIESYSTREAALADDRAPAAAGSVATGEGGE